MHSLQRNWPHYSLIDFSSHFHFKTESDQVRTEYSEQVVAFETVVLMAGADLIGMLLKLLNQLRDKRRRCLRPRER